MMFDEMLTGHATFELSQKDNNPGHFEIVFSFSLKSLRKLARMVLIPQNKVLLDPRPLLLYCQTSVLVCR